MLDYNDRAVIQHLRNSNYYHTSACLTARVDAFCDDVPDPGCTCTGAARVEKLVADVERRAAERDSRDLARGEAIKAMRSIEAMPPPEHPLLAEHRDAILNEPDWTTPS